MCVCMPQQLLSDGLLCECMGYNVDKDMHNPRFSLVNGLKWLDNDNQRGIHVVADVKPNYQS